MKPYVFHGNRPPAGPTVTNLMRPVTEPESPDHEMRAWSRVALLPHPILFWRGRNYKAPLHRCSPFKIALQVPRRNELSVGVADDETAPI